jgi:hypothetical protein
LRRKEWPARGFDGGRRRWPRRLGEHGEESVVLGNKRAWEVHGCLGKLPEQLVGGEHERGALAQRGGGNGGEERGVARGGERGRV